MKAIRYILLVLVLIGLLAGCTEETKVISEAPSDNHDARVRGTVHGLITTSDTNTPVASVIVVYAVQGETRETRSDGNGVYRADGLSEGVYTFTFFSPDTSYTDWSQMIVVQHDSATAHPSSRDFEVVIRQNIVMFRRNAAVTGYVYARLDNQTTLRVANAEVVATGFGGVLNASFLTATDPNGRYSFENLPAVGTINIVCRPWITDTLAFGTGAVAVNLVGGAQVIANNITLLPAAPAIVVMSNNFANGDFEVSSNLQLVFNRPVERNSLSNDLRRAGIPVAVVDNLDDSGVILTLDPVPTLRTNSTYTLTVQGQGVDRTAFAYGPVSFTTQRGITLLSTNLWQDEGFERTDVGLNESIYFVFDRGVDTESRDNRVWARRTPQGTDVLIDWYFSANRETLFVSPVGSYRGLTHYAMGYRLFSTLPNDFADGSFTFWTLDQTVVPGQVAGLGLDTAIHVNWNTTQLRLQWNAVETATYYEIYGYDNYNQTDRIRLDSILSPSPFGIISRNITLPLTFDWLPNDGIQTPFSNGINAMFIVRAGNSAGTGAFSAATTARDVVAPGGYAIFQDSTANNTRTAPRRVRCTFANDIEYCSSAAPVWGFIEAGGDANYVLPASAATWQWDADLRNGTLIITVPAQTNGSGDRLWISRVTDNSNNAQADSVFRTLN